MAKLKRWLIHTIIGGILGFVLGYCFGWIWFFSTLLLLGYDDSGPSWVNLVSDLLFYFGLAVGIVGAQIVFFAKERSNTKRLN
ncbi:MAG: hypothetical protein ACYTBZ_29400 [Planctomycetota bacterium]|jgi:hypothetical protein